jgi:predicted Ser/Thr protein kinase
MVLQNPRIAFRSAELKQIAIAKDRLNQPRAWSGAFATVYQGNYPNGRGSLAIRVFTSAAPERRERYQAIAEYLRGRRVAPLVGFEYADDGIRSASDGKFYPLVTMEWVPGETLFKWVRKQCLDKNRKALAQACERWIELVGQLDAARIAHGDLQHANVMVTDRGELKLVDYDCMCVPALAGRKNLEIGVDPYQHPARDHDTPLSLELDHYSALFILTALKALAADPGLWNTFVERPQHDKLLFRREDLDDPARSTLIRALKKSPDAEVGRLCEQLIELRQVPIAGVPRLADLLFSFSSVEKLLGAREFDAAIDMLSRAKKAPADAPAALQPKLREAQQRVQGRIELERAVAAGDEAAMQRLFQPKLFDDYPSAQPAAAVAQRSGEVIALLAQLDDARRAQAWRALVQIWDAHQALLDGRKSAAKFDPEVRAWREKNRACDVVLSLLKQPICDAGALSMAWEKLVALGGHPEAEPERAKIEKLLKRQRAWSAFQKASAAPGQAADEQLVKAWHESLFRGWNTAERERPRVVAAKERLDLLKRLAGIASSAPTIAGEEELVRAARGLPPDYQHELRARLHAARERLLSLDKLQHALLEPASDLGIASAWENLEQLGAQSLVPAEQRGRALQAAARAPALYALKQLPPDYPASQAPQLDARLLGAWNEDLLDGCHDAAAWRPAYQTAVRRKHVLEDLKKAIAAVDKHKIVDLYDEPCLHHYPLPADWVRAAKGAMAEVKATRRLLAVLAHDSPGDFLEAFDARIVRHNRAAFAAHADRIGKWLRAEILPAAKIGLTPPLARQALATENGSHATYRLCWRWPEPRFTDQCLLAVCRNKPRPGEDPRQLAAWVRLPVDRKSYEEGGGSRLLHVDEAWRGAYLAVWAMVDVGFETFASEPLILGRLEAAPAKPARWSPNWFGLI